MRIKRIAGLLATALLGGVIGITAVALAAGTPGKWKGTLTDFSGSTVKFKVKAHRHKRKVVSFVAHGTYGSLHCHGQIDSATISVPKAKVKGNHISATFHRPAGAGEIEIVALAGNFTDKKHASGAVDQEFYDSSGTNVCGTPQPLSWKAKLSQ